MSLKRTEARWWSETPDGELVAEYESHGAWWWAYMEASSTGHRLIFRSSETYETS